MLTWLVVTFQETKSLSRYFDLIHKSKIIPYFFSKVSNRDIAEDIFQETFIHIKTLKNGVYNEEGKFLSWVMRISHNLIIDYFRKSNRMPKFEASDDYDVFQFITDNAPTQKTI